MLSTESSSKVDNYLCVTVAKFYQVVCASNTLATYSCTIIKPFFAVKKSARFGEAPTHWQLKAHLLGFDTNCEVNMKKIMLTLTLTITSVEKMVYFLQYING